MDGFNWIGKTLVLIGALVAGLGLLISIAPKIPWVGRLPGDIIIEKRNFSIYFPLTTSILLSVMLTLLFNLFKR